MRRLLLIGVVSVVALAAANFAARKFGEPGGILDRLFFPIP